ncbi:MAG: hypothetical protein KBT21_09275 [Treponema sp.]|nr:hypothetical protein [Candidatus Treponema merdequi]
MIPQLLLEEINLGEKKAEDYYDKYGKEELEAALKELRKSDEEILLQYPFEKVIPEKLKSEESADKNVKIVDFAKFRKVGFAAAAALAVLVSAPIVIRSLNSDTAQNDSIRLKGAESKQTLKLYKQDGGSAVLLNNGAKVKSGDVIQISYVAGKNDYGLIFSIDGNGNVTKHFPDSTWKAAKLNHNMIEVPLDFSYELDDAPNYECFVFVTGDKPFVLDELSMIDSKDAKLDIIKDSQYVPKTCVKSIFMLKK